MNRLVFIIFSIILIIGQKLIFDEPITVIADTYPIQVFIYPMIILALPVGFERSGLLILSFIIGLSVDVLLDTLGMNAFALLLMTYLRQPVLNMIEPRQGYKTGSISIKSYGIIWTLSYLALLLFMHILAFFIVDIFTLVYSQKILFSSILSLLATMPIGLLIIILIKVR